MQGTPFDFFVQWHVTETCNLTCRHCYQQDTGTDMTFEEIRKAVDNISSAVASWAKNYDMQISPSFQFTGGEPLTRPDILHILDYARSNKFSTSLLTNGTLVTRDIARQLHDGQVSSVQVSLDGMEDVHDRLRGEGSFQTAVDGIKHLVASGIDTNINLTLSRLNTGEIDGLAHLAHKLGVKAITFSRLVPCGRGKELAGQMLTAWELAGVYNDIRKAQFPREITVNSRDPLFTVAAMQEQVVEADFPVGGCAAGVFGITIGADGSIMPCRRMALSIGNIKEQSFRQLWAESPALWALRNRQAYHGGCESCRYWAVCRGCRAVALAFARNHGSDDYLSPDPQCPYYQRSESSQPLSPVARPV